MFNKSDDSVDVLNTCCTAVSSVAQDPHDYFVGLPDPLLVLPKNILLFSRKKSFGGPTPMYHHRFLLIICLKEKGTVIIDEHALHLSPGKAALVTPHQFHHYGRFSNPNLLWLGITFELDNQEA